MPLRFTTAPNDSPARWFILTGLLSLSLALPGCPTSTPTRADAGIRADAVGQDVRVPDAVATDAGSERRDSRLPAPPDDAVAADTGVRDITVDVPEPWEPDTEADAGHDSTVDATASPDVPDTATPPDIVPDVETEVSDADGAPDLTESVDTAPVDTVDDDVSVEPGCGMDDDDKTSRPVPESRAGVHKVVNGEPEHDPDVVSLSEGQLRAIGALYQYSYSWFGGWDWRLLCTGTLVAERTVLTAAHCVEGLASDTQLEFRLGVDSAEPYATLEVASFAHHPDYDPGAETANRDIAVAFLAEDPRAAQSDIEWIPVNFGALPRDFQGAQVQNVGYGATTASVFGDDNTRRWWTVEEVTSVQDFEFIVWGRGESSVCFGDSGGPALYRFPDGVVRVAGVVSWGDPSCVDYDHYTRTDHNAPWWEETVGPITPPDDCEALGTQGRCAGNTAIWCDEAGEVVVEDCAAQGWICDGDDAGLSRCDPGACDFDVTWLGFCDGDVARWCEDGTPRRFRCGACDQACGWAGDDLGYHCITR